MVETMNLPAEKARQFHMKIGKKMKMLLPTHTNKLTLHLYPMIPIHPHDCQCP